MADYDVPAAVEETAKAIQSISETSRGLGSYLAAVMGEAPYTVGQIINNRLNAYRFKKMVDYTVAAKKLLEDAGLRAEDLQLPPPAIEVPLLAAASLEDRDELCDLWEKLLAASMAPSTRNRVRARHIEIIKSLEPLDANVLSRIESISNEASEESRKRIGSAIVDYQDFERKALSEFNVGKDELHVALTNLVDLHVVVHGNSEMPHVTSIGRNFLSVVTANLNPE